MNNITPIPLECTIDRLYISWDIDAKTSVDQYEEQKKANAGVEVKDYFCGIPPLNPLELSVTVGNAVLVAHIAKTEPDLLSCSTSYWGLSPLVRAALMIDHVQGLKMAEILICSGAKCNLRTVKDPKAIYFEGYIPLVYPREATPLIIALEKSRNLALIMFLEQNGGSIEALPRKEESSKNFSDSLPVLSKEGKAVFNIVLNCKLILLSKNDKKSFLNLPCSDVLLHVVYKLIILSKEIPLFKPIVRPTVRAESCSSTVS